MWVIGVCLVLSGAPGWFQSMTKQQAIELAERTLLEEEELEAAQLELVSALAVEWPDRSLGCPEKGRLYAQVLTPGYRVVFRADGRDYPVHVGGGRAVLCRSKEQRSRAVPKAERLSELARVSEKARRHLASELKTPKDQIRVRLVKAVTWPDAGLGCPEKVTPEQNREAKGYLIELEHKKRIYEIHADATGDRLCRAK